MDGVCDDVFVAGMAARATLAAGVSPSGITLGAVDESTGDVQRLVHQTHRTVRDAQVRHDPQVGPAGGDRGRGRLPPLRLWLASRLAARDPSPALVLP